MIYVGIDPGLDGAIAVLDRETASRDAETLVFDIPTIQISKPSGNRRIINEGMLRAAINGLLSRAGGSNQNIEAALEDVHAMPGQGVRSMFSMGEGKGILRGMFAQAGISYKLVAPQTWKKYHGLIGADKEASRLLAIQGFPQVAGLLTRKRDHGRAEALLLADFARARRA